jgi:hypothetical protein
MPSTRGLMVASALLMAGSAQAADAPPLPDQAWFQHNTQALFDALTDGVPSVWDQALADGFVVSDEDGNLVGRAELIKSIRPLPSGSVGHIDIVDLVVRGLGSAAVVHYLIDETEDVQGQHLHTKYRETDTYAPEGSTWKIVASHVTVVPRDMDPVPVDPSGFARLVGDYRISPADTHGYHVYLRDGPLFGGRDEKSATRLIPLSPLVFFQSGSIHTMIFVADAKGAITAVREVHKYNELSMQRICP